MHADRPSLGLTACALQLCDALSCVLAVCGVGGGGGLPEYPGSKELVLLKAAPEEWSAPNHSELLAMVAQVWGVGPLTSRQLQEVLQALATNLNRCGDLVREMASISAGTAGAGSVAGGGGGKGRAGGGKVAVVGAEVWSAAIAGLEGCQVRSLLGLLVQKYKY